MLRGKAYSFAPSLVDLGRLGRCFRAYARNSSSSVRCFPAPRAIFGFTERAGLYRLWGLETQEDSANFGEVAHRYVEASMHTSTSVRDACFEVCCRFEHISEAVRTIVRVPQAQIAGVSGRIGWTGRGPRGMRSRRHGIDLAICSAVWHSNADEQSRGYEQAAVAVVALSKLLG